MGGSDDGVMWIGQWCGGGDTVSAASVGGGVGGGGSCGDDNDDVIERKFRGRENTRRIKRNISIIKSSGEGRRVFCCFDFHILHSFLFPAFRLNSAYDRKSMGR